METDEYLCPTCGDPECCSNEEWTDGECAHPENYPEGWGDCHMCGTHIDEDEGCKCEWYEPHPGRP